MLLALLVVSATVSEDHVPLARLHGPSLTHSAIMATCSIAKLLENEFSCAASSFPCLLLAKVIVAPESASPRLLVTFRPLSLPRQRVLLLTLPRHAATGTAGRIPIALRPAVARSPAALLPLLCAGLLLKIAREAPFRATKTSVSTTTGQTAR